MKKTPQQNPNRKKFQEQYSEKIYYEIVFRGITEKPIILKAGIYLIADPCLIEFSKTYRLPAKTEYAYFSTQYGDGTFQSTCGQLFSIESGTIICLPYDKQNMRLTQTPFLKPKQIGHSVTFSADIFCKQGEQEGRMQFGNIFINGLATRI